METDATIPKQAAVGLPNGVYWHKLRITDGQVCTKCRVALPYATTGSPDPHDKRYRHKLMLLAGTPEEMADRYSGGFAPELWDGKIPNHPAMSQADPIKMWGQYKPAHKSEEMQKDEAVYSAIHLLPPLITLPKKGDTE